MNYIYHHKTNNIIFKVVFLLSCCFGMTVVTYGQSGVDTSSVDEVVHLGFSSQRKSQLTGAVATVQGTTLEQSPVANLQQAFEGRFTGLFTRETNSTLARSSTQLNIRGTSRNSLTSPIIVIDGIVFNYMTEDAMAHYITPEEVESITILKDASAQALYGSQGVNGVIVITTKKGSVGPLKVSANISQAIQEVTTRPAVISAGEYAALRNQAAYNDGRGLNAVFSPDAVEFYHTGTNPDFYPNNNWYDRFFEDYALMQRGNVNFSGGNEHVRYFSSLGVMNQGGQFETEQPDYDSRYGDSRLNFRSNINAKLHRYIDAHLYLSGGVIRSKNAGNIDIQDMYASMFHLPPTMYGPISPAVIYEATGETLHPGNNVLVTDVVQNSTYGMLNRSGFTRNTHVNIATQFGLDVDLEFLTKGLKATGTFAYRTFSYNNLTSLQNYERWVRTNDLNVLEFQRIGSIENTPLQYSKFAREFKSMTFQANMNYDRRSGKHHTHGLLYASNQNLEQDNRESPWNIPVKRMDMGIEGGYSYADKYFIKVNTGFSGVDLYARENRYLFTPSVSGAWTVSNEPFLDNVFWLNTLKLRASYGITGSQHVTTRYSYLDDILFTPGGPIAEFRHITSERSFGNPNIRPETSAKQNYGVDLEFFNSLTISADLFSERMENMVVTGTGTIPAYQGIPLDVYPPVNQGVFENKGYDIQAIYKKTLHPNLSISLGGFVSHAKNKVISAEETPNMEDFAFRYRAMGFSYGTEFGYLVDYSNNGNGFFNSAEEINLTYEFGTPRVGDLKYRDLNNDGIINEKDRAPIGTGRLPRYTYGFSGGVNYKSFDLSFLFQGVGQWSSIMGGMGVYETSHEGVFGSLHRNAWTQERYDNGETISYPALSLNASTNHVPSDFFRYNLAYLRLKNVVVGYTLPENVLQRARVENLRIFLTGQNLLTWDNMKTKDFGPEGSYASIPVYRVFNVGVSVGF